VITTFDANGEGKTSDSAPVETTADEKEAICEAGIKNEDASLKA